ncbi:hypothetical protein C900_03742 [Fulvivirga imtechensis AK7]|uniref:Uncharacterized protein n=1 Tax=Fulvivirga imtechensis AK7 TaxID=1237149 RepID=L8JQB1_9BACT|nr:hypothetical protein C900_03742 [Fulvivirga imtechensis AK7]
MFRKVFYEVAIKRKAAFFQKAAPTNHTKQVSKSAMLLFYTLRLA